MVKTAISFGFKYGIYLGILLILFGLVFNLGKFHYKSSLGYIFYLAVPVVIFLSLRAYLTNEGILTFGKGVSVSSIVAVVGCLLLRGSRLDHHRISITDADIFSLEWIHSYHNSWGAAKGNG